MGKLMDRRLLLALCLLLAACTPGSPTATPSGCFLPGGVSAHALFEDYAGRWLVATERAAGAERYALAPEVQALGGLRERLAAEGLPECGRAAQRSFLALMDAAVAGYMGILRQQSPVELDRLFDQVIVEEAALKAELQRLPR